MSDDDQAVLAALDARPQTLDELASSLFMPRRIVEKAIQRARLEGYPIASDSRGVWLGSLTEIRATEKALYDRVKAQLTTYKAVKRTRKKLEEPATLWPELT